MVFCCGMRGLRDSESIAYCTAETSSYSPRVDGRIGWVLPVADLLAAGSFDRVVLTDHPGAVTGLLQNLANGNHVVCQQS